MAGLDRAATMSDEELLKKQSDAVDARDIATAHVELLEREAASMQRFLVDARTSQTVDILIGAF